MVVYLWPTLLGVMIAFGSMKVIEYSVMTAATEMIYMPMDKDVRYLGKELVKFFGHKLGKSGSSIVLSTVSATLKPSLSVQSGLTFLTTWFWAFSMYILATHLQHRDGTKTKRSSDTDISEYASDDDESRSDVIYGSDSGTPLSLSYSPPIQGYDGQSSTDCNSDVGMSLDDDDFSRDSVSGKMQHSGSGETICCRRGSSSSVVYGVVSINDSQIEEKDSVGIVNENSSSSHQGIRHRSRTGRHSRGLSASADPAISSDPQPSAVSTFLSIFYPQKTHKRNTMLRIGSEAVALTTLIEKQARRHNDEGGVEKIKPKFI
jgi:hypothetical protein